MLPNLTAEQRVAALAKAKEVRRLRALLREELRTGKLNIVQALDPLADPVVAKTKVKALLQMVPGVGVAKATWLMDTVGIAPNRRVGGLGERQRRALIEHFER